LAVRNLRGGKKGGGDGGEEFAASRLSPRKNKDLHERRPTQPHLALCFSAVWNKGRGEENVPYNSHKRPFSKTKPRGCVRDHGDQINSQKKKKKKKEQPPFSNHLGRGGGGRSGNRLRRGSQVCTSVTFAWRKEEKGRDRTCLLAGRGRKEGRGLRKENTKRGGEKKGGGHRRRQYLHGKKKEKERIGDSNDVIPRKPVNHGFVAEKDERGELLSPQLFRGRARERWYRQKKVTSAWVSLVVLPKRKNTAWVCHGGQGKKKKGGDFSPLNKKKRE